MKNMWLEDMIYPYEIFGFMIYEDHAICNNCGATVGRGIIPTAVHWNECAGKGQVDALKKMFEDKRSKGEEVTEQDVDSITNKKL